MSPARVRDLFTFSVWPISFLHAVLLLRSYYLGYLCLIVLGGQALLRLNSLFVNTYMLQSATRVTVLYFSYLFSSGMGKLTAHLSYLDSNASSERCQASLWHAGCSQLCQISWSAIPVHDSLSSQVHPSSEGHPCEHG